MVKVRMNTADVAAEVKCLKRFIGMRCSNVYDLNPKTYVFKLTNSSGLTQSGESEKVLVLMESGVRLHTTAYVRDKDNTPSAFTLKLRKHIRYYRLEDVYQLGYDRIVFFQFGLGSNAHYIILELYAQGNILLADSEFTVLTLLRSHRDDNKGFATMSRHRYPVEMCRTFSPTSTDKLSEALLFKNNEGDELVKAHDDDEPVQEKPKMENSKNKGGNLGSSNKSSKQVSLKMILGDVLGYGPALSEHIILDAGLVPNKKLSKDDRMDDASISLLGKAVTNFEKWLQDVISGKGIPEGYILMQEPCVTKGLNVGNGTESSNQVYDEVCPLLMKQFQNREYAKFDTFDAALDEFYSKYDSQRVEKQLRSREDSAVQKLDKIRQDQENRVRSLTTEVDRCVKTAELIEYNLEDVDNAILAVRVSLAKGTSWEDVTSMVKEEKKSGNPIAGMIDKLNFERNCITLLLTNNLDEMDDEEKTLPVTKVEIDLSLSAHANARSWYEMKKKQESKQEKTVAAHAKAFKAAEKKTRLQLAKEKVIATIYHTRKVHWFEKFNWFISSENYLIISGRDAQQNEMLVKRYMSKEDLYVHADLHGASSTVIKNHRPNQPIPPLTLNQAGCFTVCHSQAWNSKIVIGAWWVSPYQVSKTAPTGEYLTVGSFMIRGKKNFLPPHPLVMGFGLLFRLDESSVAAHLNERKIRTEDSLNDIADEGYESVEPCSNSEDEMPDPKSFKLSAPPAADEISQLDELIDKTLSIGTTKLSTAQPNDEPPLPLKPEAFKDKPHMSKSDRKKLKKDQTSNALPTHSSSAADTNKQSSAKISRGQRSKLKKIKEKYADQDEEERKIRLALLASAGNAHKENEDNKVQEKNSSVNQEAAKVCYRCKKAGHLVVDCTEDNNEMVTNDSNDDDDIREIGEEDKAKLNDVDCLTGCPQMADILLYAVPVCGPYNALQSYKYRVKITPGTLKKGKAVKTAVNLFSHLADVSNREKELMKACTDPELVAALVGNVKLSAAGLTQLKQKPKKGRPTELGSTD